MNKMEQIKRKGANWPSDTQFGLSNYWEGHQWLCPSFIKFNNCRVLSTQSSSHLLDCVLDLNSFYFIFQKWLNQTSISREPSVNNKVWPSLVEFGVLNRTKLIYIRKHTHQQHVLLTEQTLQLPSGLFWNRPSKMKKQITQVMFLQTCSIAKMINDRNDVSLLE